MEACLRAVRDGVTRAHVIDGRVAHSVLLEVFTVALFACAVAAEYIGTIFARLYAHSIVARTAAERGHALWISLTERLHLTAFLVGPEHLRLVAARLSDSRLIEAVDRAMA